jgi:hypothetical protein
MKVGFVARRVEGNVAATPIGQLLVAGSAEADHFLF